MMESLPSDTSDNENHPNVTGAEIDEDLRSKEVFLVHCNKIAGELHKSRFGSGSSGPCISMDGEQFLTPVQFEAACGRAASKDWRSSIKFGSSPLKTLIEREVLVPHSTRCGCSVCVDKVVAGERAMVLPPVKVATPYKKRKNRNEGNEEKKLKTEHGPNTSAPPAPASSLVGCGPEQVDSFLPCISLLLSLLSCLFSRCQWSHNLRRVNHAVTQKQQR